MNKKLLMAAATLFLAGSIHFEVNAQNAIVGTGFSSGWGGGGCPTGNNNFAFLSPGAGTSYIVTLNAPGTGNRFFRFGIDWGGTTAHRTITPGSDVPLAPSTTYNLNAGCTTSGAMSFNVSNTSHNYVFKTLNAGANPTGTFVVFQVEGTVRSVSSLSQLPLAGAVIAGTPVTVTANLNGALSAGQDVYLRYSSNGFASSTVVKLTGTGTTYTGTIPGTVHTTGTSVSYYVFTSGPSNVNADGSNADLYTINLNNNGGANYSYSVVTPRYRSKSAGPNLWSAATSWEISTDGGSTWSDASVSPAANIADAISIRNGHIMNIDANVTIDQVTVETGGVLQRLGGAFHPLIILNDGPGDDLWVQANSVFRIFNSIGASDYINTINYVGGAKILVAGTGMLEVNNSAGSEFWRLGTEPIARIEYQHEAVFYWNPTSLVLAPGSNGVTYFPGVAANVIPVFRINSSPSIGAASNTTINGVFEVMAGRNVTWDNGGVKIFRNGITGAGTVTQASSSGQFRINGSNSSLGIATLALHNVVTAGLAIQTGTCTLVNNVTANAGPIYVDGGATLIAGTNVLSGTASFTFNSGATLQSAHANGVDGSIAVSGTNTFNNGSNYVFNGSANQSTGAKMASTVAVLTVANPTLVALTNNNTTTNTLNLNAGDFAAGINQTIRITPGGSVNGGGGDVSINPNGEGGTIEFLGRGWINSIPALYNVKVTNSLPDGVEFVNHAVVYNMLEIGSGGFIINNAPAYGPNATLVYRTGGTFSRNIEWGNLPNPNNQGYPTNVLVDGNTIVDLNSNPLLPALTSLAISGNLQLGSDLGRGRMYLNNNMSIPLEIRGNLTIGSANQAASGFSELGLEDSQIGGDLIVHGNFHRYNSSLFTPYNRAVFLRGSSNSEIAVLPIPPAMVGVYTPQQLFPFLFIQKTGGASVSLKTHVGISAQIDLTSGVINTSESEMLVIQSVAGNAIAGGNSSSFINGPMLRNTNSTADTYNFPVGKVSGGTTYTYKPLRFSTINNLSIGDGFKAEYFGFPNATPDWSLGENFDLQLFGILRDEYWQFDRTNGNASGRLILSYNSAGNNWRDAFGDTTAPCSECNVAIVRRFVNPGNPNGAWAFTKAPFDFNDIDPALPEARFHTTSGEIISGEISSFSPFTFGFSFNTILNTLPVKLLSFDGSLKNGNAQLQWRIDSDKDLRFFELQHSINGQQYTTIGQMAPSGLSYAYTHMLPQPGRHFYRLYVHEKNGRSYYSKIVTVVYGNAGTYINGLQSTVVKSQLTAMVWSAGIQTADAALYNNAGQLLSRYPTQLAPGQNQIRIPVQNIPTGIYFLRLQTADGVQKTLRWLKE